MEGGLALRADEPDAFWHSGFFFQLLLQSLKRLKEQEGAIGLAGLVQRDWSSCFGGGEAMLCMSV